MKISAKKIIFLHLYIDIFARILPNISSSIAVVSYIPDLLNAILFGFVIRECFCKKIKEDIRRLIFGVVVLFSFDVIMFLIKGESFLLFLWGVRNQYRFIIFLVACAMFLNNKDLSKLKDILMRCFWINMVAVTIELILGYRQDLLGGTFGLDHSCNGVTNIFLCIICSYAIVFWIGRKVSMKKMMVLVIGSLYWALMAEIKVFFLELILITAIAIFFERGKVDKKMYLLIVGSIGMAVSILLISYVFPSQAFVFSPRGLINYAAKVNVGVGRLFAIPKITISLFKKDIWLELFGIGLGNGEMMSLGSILIESKFFSQYGVRYAYTTYLHALLYVERGVVGLIWYVWLYGKSFKVSYSQVKKRKFVTLNYMVMILVVCFYIIAIYDASLKTSSGGYMGYLVLAIPYMINYAQDKIYKKTR